MLVVAQAGFTSAQTITAEQREFFQKKIQPVLQAKCYSCHSSSSSPRRGGLGLDSREALLAGGNSGPVVNANDLANSTLLKSLRGQDGYRVMPPRGALDDSVIADFETWIRLGAPYPRPSSGEPGSSASRPLDDLSLPTITPSPALFETPNLEPLANCIDEPILAKLRSLGIQSAPPCSDSVFVRRVYLDVIGTLPTAKEVTQFLEDDRPDKRSVLIDELLQRDEFADYWSLRWCDLLRVKSEFPINLWPNAAQAYHRWVRAGIKANMPYDRVCAGDPHVQRQQLPSSAGELLPGNSGHGTGNGRRRGGAHIHGLHGLTGGPRNAGRKWRSSSWAFSVSGPPNGKRRSSPLISWALARPKRSTYAILPDGTRVALPTATDHRQVFADWLIRPDNPWFTGNVVNRIWYWLFGIGIVHEPDDIRHDNPPTNRELLAVLQRELVESDFDLKHIYRLILNSAAYQQSCIPATDHPEAELHFAHYPIRRLDAEVLIDAVCQITGTTESYSSLIPEPWTFIPGSERSICLADGSITSPFLELFGRPARNTGYQSERGNKPSAAQKLHLLNSGHIRDKIEASGAAVPDTRTGRRGSRRGRSSVATSSRETITDLYLRVLSRYPTEPELAAIGEYLSSADAQGPEGLIDLTWALINTSEFLYRH